MNDFPSAPGEPSGPGSPRGPAGPLPPGRPLGPRLGSAEMILPGLIEDMLGEMNLNPFSTVTKLAMSKTHSDHILYIVIGALPYERLDEIIRQAIKECDQLSPVKVGGRLVPTSYLINYIDNVMYPFAYVWFSSPHVPAMIRGLNPDGSPRVEKVHDPTWAPRPKAEWKSGMSWGDAPGDEEEEEEQMFVSRPLPSLVKLPNIETEHDAPWAGLRIGPSLLELAGPGCEPNKLISLFAPMWVTRECILSHFSRFNTDETKDAKTGQPKYPIVNIRPRRVIPGKKPINLIVVIFSSKSHDAATARVMRRNFVVANPKTNETARLVFDYSRFQEERPGGRSRAPSSSR